MRSDPVGTSPHRPPTGAVRRCRMERNPRYEPLGAARWPSGQSPVRVSSPSSAGTGSSAHVDGVLRRLRPRAIRATAVSAPVAFRVQHDPTSPGVEVAEAGRVSTCDARTATGSTYGSAGSWSARARSNTIVSGIVSAIGFVRFLSRAVSDLTRMNDRSSRRAPSDARADGGDPGHRAPPAAG